MREFLGEQERLSAIKSRALPPNCAGEMRYQTPVYIAAGLLRSVLVFACIRRIRALIQVYGDFKNLKRTLLKKALRKSQRKRHNLSHMSLNVQLTQIRIL